MVHNAVGASPRRSLDTDLGPVTGRDVRTGRASQSEGIIVEQRGAEGAWYRRALELSELLAPYAVVDNQIPRFVPGEQS